MSASSIGCETVCDNTRKGRSLRPYAALIHGRERVRSVLEPHLGPMHALERANNIVQALVYEDTPAHPVALEMLRHVPRELRSQLAQAVENAFVHHP
jgi:hypothetical protein